MQNSKLWKLCLLILSFAVISCDSIGGGGGDDDGDDSGNNNGGGNKNDAAVKQLIEKAYENCRYELKKGSYKQIRNMQSTTHTEYSEHVCAIDRTAKKYLSWGDGYDYSGPFQGFEYIDGYVGYFYTSYDGITKGPTYVKGFLNDIYWEWNNRPFVDSNDISNYYSYSWKKEGNEYIGIQTTDKNYETGTGESTRTLTVTLTADNKYFNTVKWEITQDKYDGSLDYKTTAEVTYTYENIEIEMPYGFTEDMFEAEDQVKITVKWADGTEHRFYTASSWGEDDDKVWMINYDAIAYEYPRENGEETVLYYDAAYANAVPRNDVIEITGDTVLYARYEAEKN